MARRKSTRYRISGPIPEECGFSRSVEFAHLAENTDHSRPEHRSAVWPEQIQEHRKFSVGVYQGHVREGCGVSDALQNPLPLSCGESVRGDEGVINAAAVLTQSSLDVVSAEWTMLAL